MSEQPLTMETKALPLAWGYVGTPESGRSRLHEPWERKPLPWKHSMRMHGHLADCSRF